MNLKEWAERMNVIITEFDGFMCCVQPSDNVNDYLEIFDLSDYELDFICNGTLWFAERDLFREHYGENK